MSLFIFYFVFLDFPDSSAGEESACNTGDPSSIPGSRSSPGEGIGFPLQYSWASLVAQMEKNPPTIWETWVYPWVGKIHGRRAWQPIPVFLPGEFQDRRAWLTTAHGLQRVRHDWATFTFCIFTNCLLFLRIYYYILHNFSCCCEWSTNI